MYHKSKKKIEAGIKYSVPQVVEREYLAKSSRG